MKKFFQILIILLLATAVSYALWSVSGYYLSTRIGKAPVISSEVSLTPSGDILTGALVTVSTRFELPRAQKVLTTTMTPGSGTVAAKASSARKIKSSWRYNTWLVEGTLCAIRPGASKSGVLAFELSSFGKNASKTAFTLAIPSLSIKALPALTTPQIELAQALPPVKKAVSKLHFLWLLLLLLPLAYFLFRSRKVKTEKISLRVQTLNALETLRSEVVSRTLTAEQGITRLADVIRFYLEQRYKLPASGKTTPEFLEDMENTSPLPDSDKPFLQNFLNSADLIKFAKAPCDAPAVSAAIDSAEQLVRNTALPEEEKNV